MPKCGHEVPFDPKRLVLIHATHSGNDPKVWANIARLHYNADAREVPVDPLVHTTIGDMVRPHRVGAWECETAVVITPLGNVWNRIYGGSDIDLMLYDIDAHDFKHQSVEGVTVILPSIESVASKCLEDQLTFDEAGIREIHAALTKLRVNVITYYPPVYTKHDFKKPLAENKAQAMEMLKTMKSDQAIRKILNHPNKRKADLDALIAGLMDGGLCAPGPIDKGLDAFFAAVGENKQSALQCYKDIPNLTTDHIQSIREATDKVLASFYFRRGYYRIGSCPRESRASHGNDWARPVLCFWSDLERCYHQPWPKGFAAAPSAHFPGYLDIGTWGVHSATPYHEFFYGSAFRSSMRACGDDAVTHKLAFLKKLAEGKDYPVLKRDAQPDVAIVHHNANQGALMTYLVVSAAHMSCWRFLLEVQLNCESGVYHPSDIGTADYIPHICKVLQAEHWAMGPERFEYTGPSVADAMTRTIRNCDGDQAKNAANAMIAAASHIDHARRNAYKALVVRVQDVACDHFWKRVYLSCQAGRFFPDLCNAITAKYAAKNWQADVTGDGEEADEDAEPNYDDESRSEDDDDWNEQAGSDWDDVHTEDMADLD